MNEAERQALEEVRAMLAPLRIYTVEKILGAGAAGYVLKVHHRVFGDRAMKLVHPNLLRSQIVRSRFDTEAHIMHMLTHPNVVKVHDLGEVGDFPYIVMDFLEGGTLEDHLNEFGTMPPKQAVHVAVAILRGLQAAHNRGIVHRDIKPQNVLFAKDGTPKITDFGIARVEEGARSMTREGSAMGTFAYMPPEQLNGQMDLIDSRSDIHAVGVTLYVMLTCGKLGQDAFFRQIEAYPERLNGIPDILQMVIRIATAQMRESRFLTATAMADELEIYLVDGLPDDPEDTPALGSAPAHAHKSDLAEAQDASILRGSNSLAPGETRVQDGYEVASHGDMMEVSHVSVMPPVVRISGVLPDTGEWDVELPSGTIAPTGIDRSAEVAQVADIRQTAKRRFYWRVVLPVVGLLLALVVGVGVWFATRPVPIVEAEPVISTVVEPAIHTVTEPLPVLAVAPIVEPTQEPTPVELSSTPAAVVKPNPTHKVVVRPPPEATVTAQETAQVRLILKPNTNATVTLSGNGGTFTLTGGSREVPQGTYRVSVDMPGRETPQTGTLTVTPGLNTVTCDSRFKMCTGFK